MKIERVFCALGRSGYMHRDLAAMKAGAKRDGFLFHGKPLTPGFRKIVEPATIISVMLVLEDGQIAFGDCADVILAGAAGRDPRLPRRGPYRLPRRRDRASSCGRDIGKFRPHAEEIDRLTHGGKPLHTALRYGLTQALLHAAALARKPRWRR